MNQRKVLHAAAAAATDGTIMQTRNALLAVQVSGTFVATVTWKITVDGTNWITVEGVSRADGEKATTATAPGIYLIPVVPGGAFMADITAYTSGSVTVTVLDTDGHVDLSDTGSASLTGNLPDTATGDLAAQTAALQGTLTTENARYQTVKTGEIQGAAAATQLPDIACKLVKFKARQDNAGFVYLGASGVTKPDGTTDAATGYELDAAEETGWIPVDNLNRFYRICDNAGDDLTYMALT